MLFIGHRESIIYEGVKLIGSNFFVGQVNSCTKGGEINVDPIWILRVLIKKQGIFDNGTIHGIIESVGIARLVKGPICFLRQRYLEITPWPWSVFAIAGDNKD